MAPILMRSSRRPRRARRKARSLLFLLGSSSSLPGVGAVWTGDITILGGCGHVGLPLGLAFADAGMRVALYDTNLTAVDQVRSGKMPHLEPGAPEVLARTLAVGHPDRHQRASGGRRRASTWWSWSGTPVDEHLNPDPHAVVSAIEAVADHLADGQLLILRSTVFPGVTRLVERLIDRLGRVHRRRLLPRADRRGPGHGGAPHRFPRSWPLAPTAPTNEPPRSSAT